MALRRIRYWPRQAAGRNRGAKTNGCLGNWPRRRRSSKSKTMSALPAAGAGAVGRLDFAKRQGPGR